MGSSPTTLKYVRLEPVKAKKPGPDNPKIVPRILGLTPSEAVQWLADSFTYSAHWKTPKYKTLDPDLRVLFSESVQDGSFRVQVRNLLACCLQHGVELDDKTIKAALCVGRGISPKKSLSPGMRKELRRVAVQLLPLYFRLWAEEVVLVADDVPAVVNGRWAATAIEKPAQWSGFMTLGQCAKKTGLPYRGLVGHLRGAESIRFNRGQRSRIRYALNDVSETK